MTLFFGRAALHRGSFNASPQHRTKARHIQGYKNHQQGSPSPCPLHMVSTPLKTYDTTRPPLSH
jgi:hypothetical protein